MAADASECNIKVVCRFRPQSASEDQQGGGLTVKFPANDTVIHAVSLSKRTCNFERLLHPWFRSSRFDDHCAQI